MERMLESFITLFVIMDPIGNLPLFISLTKGMPLKNVDITKLVERTNGYVGADIEAICREAAINALRRDIKSKEVTNKDFDDALKKVSPSVTKEIEKAYEELQDHFKKARAKQMEEEKPSYMG